MGTAPERRTEVWIMAQLEFTSRRTRTAAVPHPPSQPNRASGVGRPQGRLENAREVGRTMLILGLIAVSIVALRYVMVMAYGFLD